MSETLLNVFMNDREYIVRGEVAYSTDMGLEVENASVIVDGKKKADFGFSFQGQRFDADDVATSIVRTYVNNDSTCRFKDVHKELENFKNTFFEDSGFEFDGRKVPNKYISDRVLELAVINSDGLQYYSDGEYYALVAQNGNLITDIEAFYMGSLYEDFDANKFLYNSPLIEEYADEIFN